jgi:hypothetical protein
VSYATSLPGLLRSAERLEELSGVPVVSLEDYRRGLAAAWKNLWTGEAGRQERNLQHFLEAHPCLIPGFRSFNTDSGHAPFPAAVITQPKLPELSTKQPDFCWIATDSVWLYAVMVEIETPDKRWFIRASGMVSARGNCTGISFMRRASLTTGKHGSLNRRTRRPSSSSIRFRIHWFTGTSFSSTCSYMAARRNLWDVEIFSGYGRVKIVTIQR